MAKQTVSLFLESLENPRKDEILRLREIVLGSGAELTEQIKWNAPSFCKQGDDRVTMRINPPGKLQLIFHRGAKVKASDDFAFRDPTGRLSFAAADRAILDIAAGDLENMKSDITLLVEAWISAT